MGEGAARRSGRWLAAALAVALLLASACGPRRARDPWHAVPVPTDAEFNGVWFTDSLNGWLTGGGWAIDGGIVGRTRDGGRTWRFESEILPGAGMGAGLARVGFRDTLHGCAAADQGRVLVTDDGGSSWRPASTAGGRPGSLFDIQFIDAWNGWAAGTSIVRTEDGGETWHTLVRGASENGYLSANAIHFTDPSQGWLVSHGGIVMHTEDGGRDWTPVALPFHRGEHPTLWDLTFTDPAHGWIVGEQGSIFRTLDGGATWSREEQGVPIVRTIPASEPRRPREPVPGLETEPDRLSLMAVRFADSQHGWAVGSYADVAESVVLHTGDGGASWTVEHVQPGELLRALFVLDVDHAWAAGDRARTQPQVVLRYARSAH